MQNEEDIPFEAQPREEQAELVRAEMAIEGTSYLEAALRLKTTKGRVARICHDFGIPSTNPPPASMNAARASKKAQESS